MFGLRELKRPIETFFVITENEHTFVYELYDDYSMLYASMTETAVEHRSVESYHINKRSWKAGGQEVTCLRLSDS